MPGIKRKLYWLIAVITPWSLVLYGLYELVMHALAIPHPHVR